MVGRSARSVPAAVALGRHVGAQVQCFQPSMDPEPTTHWRTQLFLRVGVAILHTWPNFEQLESRRIQYSSQHRPRLLLFASRNEGMSLLPGMAPHVLCNEESQVHPGARRPRLLGLATAEASGGGGERGGSAAAVAVALEACHR